VKRRVIDVVLGMVVVSFLAMATPASANTSRLYNLASPANAHFYLGTDRAPWCAGKAICGAWAGASLIMRVGYATDETWTYTPDWGSPHHVVNKLGTQLNPGAGGVIHVIDSPVAYTEAGASVLLWQPTPDTRQQWMVYPAEGMGYPYPGCFVIVNWTSQLMVLGALNGQVANGAPVNQRVWAADLDQFWCAE
jgi:hypothetical protein